MELFVVQGNEQNFITYLYAECEGRGSYASK